MTITTFLLDLDDTLIGNPMATFLPPYFAMLEQRLRPFLPDGADLPGLMSASVRAMQADKSTTVTNLAAFMADFTRRIGHAAEDVEHATNTFYAKDFPKLRQYVTCRSEAPAIVRYLLSGSYKVVIATNPLFPATAIEQRMEWGGVKDFPYALVTTLENSHFSKPNPSYYQEILHKVNSTPKETWMIGDDFKNDIVPAASVGIRTWWITETVPSGESMPLFDQAGSLAKFLTWLREEFQGQLSSET